MVQPFSKSPQSHLPRYLVAGGVAVIALWWGLSFSGSAPQSPADGNAAAAEQASDLQNTQASGQNGLANIQSDSAQNQSGSSATDLAPAADGTSQGPGAQTPNTVSFGSSPTPAMLSNGSSLEDQLQAQRSAELHDRYPVEETPSGVATKPPAAPGAANPHQ